MFGAHSFGAPYFGQAESLRTPPVPITAISSLHVTDLANAGVSANTFTDTGVSANGLTSSGIHADDLESV